MTFTTQLGIRRDGSNLVPILGTDSIPRARWSRHARLDAELNRSLPIHLTLRDCPPQGPVRDAMRRHAPRALAILDDFESGAIATRDAAIRADAEYSAALGSWLVQQHAGRGLRTRTDADSVWLQAETIFWMSRILSARYLSPTIFNVIPTEVLGTTLTTYRQIVEDETDEAAVIGDTFEPMGVPGSNAERGEIIRHLMFYKYGASWTDRELEIEAEVRRNGQGPAWSLVDKKTGGAKRALDSQRAWIAAFGLYYDSKGLPGLLYGSPPATAAEEAEYCSADPEANVNALLALVADQEAAVQYREDQIADTLALDPASYAFLSRQQYSDGVTTFESTSLENFMRRATGIRKVVVASEFRSQGAAAVAKVLEKAAGGVQAVAERLSGGIRKEGEQRSVAMIYRASPEVFAHVVGRPLETVTWPSHFGRHSTVMRESTGGVVFFEPLGAKMIFRAAAGDAA